ncbi:MAG: hypothetical protein IPI11_17840 [Haliscomenobacter sp.]|nr:hypothetical protein [Haliscomenobacter sp.]
MSYSSTLLYTAQKDRQQRDAKRLAILQQAALDAEADKRTLLQLLQRHAALQRELDAQRAVHALDTELYRFYEKQAVRRSCCRRSSCSENGNSCSSAWSWSSWRHGCGGSRRRCGAWGGGMGDSGSMGTTII